MYETMCIRNADSCCAYVDYCSAEVLGGREGGLHHGACRPEVNEACPTSNERWACEGHGIMTAFLGTDLSAGRGRGPAGAPDPDAPPPA